MPDKTRILFLSNTHSARGPLAEYLLKTRQPETLTVESAGIAATTVNAMVATVLLEQDNNILNSSDITSRAIADLEPTGYDIVITLSEAARRTCTANTLLGFEERRRLFGGIPTFLHWPIADPALTEGDEQQMLACYRTTRDTIDQHIQQLLDNSYLDAITRERNRLHQFAELFEDGLIIHDQYRIFFLVNEKFLRLTGRTREEVIGHDCHDIFPNGGLCSGACQFQGNSSGPTEQTEYPILVTAPDQPPKYMNVRTLPVVIEPGRRGIMSIVSDETKLVNLTAQLQPRHSFHGMVGVSAVVQEVFRSIESVAASDYPVLVTGESGTGKELVASAIHLESKRSQGPFVPVNCGALPENILESELFGHVRGAFTGAIRDKKGRFELANGGTLFLDEIGELTPSVQVKLLRVLQEKSFERVGGEKSIKADVRIVSATNRDLKDMMHQGTFREDLFYRLCVIPIALPPLRERREDIPYLIEHFLERIRNETGKQIDSLDTLAMDLILSYRWPGNIRELINALQLAAVQSNGKRIRGQHLPLEVRRPSPTSLETQAIDSAPPPVSTKSFTRPIPPGGQRTKLTPQAVEQALAATGGNKLKAAKMLGVGRATLYRFFKAQDNQDKT